MKYFWPIIGLIVCIILFFNVDTKLFSWIGTPLFLVMTIIQYFRYIKK
jgi:cell shape-determining protein MreC